MKTGKHILLTLLVGLTACSDKEGWTVEDDRPVVADLSLAVSPTKVPTTRMEAGVVQANGNFRGLQDLRAIPFATTGKITVNDRPKAFDTEGFRAEEYKKDRSSFYTFEGCNFMTGVSSFIIYARALANMDDEGRPQDKSRFGSLICNIPANAYPSGISFSPEPIFSDEELPDDGVALADYLTAIANTRVDHLGRTYTWRAAADTRLRAFFENFTGQGNQSNALLASSTASVKQYVAALRGQINALQYEAATVESLLQSAILQNIDDGYDNLPADYPASIDLPDGAAVVRWEGWHFVPQTNTTTLANISSIYRYAYPPELYYTANSLIKTSTQEDLLGFYATESSWEQILSHYEYDNGTITNNTTGIAVKEPLQYAVGRLQLRFSDLHSSTLTDADGQAVAVGGTRFPLTGVIVGSQRPVGFDFTPASNSDVDTRFVYDSHPVTASGEQLYIGSGGNGQTTNTLLLQTCDGEDVTIMLEFQNNSGVAFRGVGGVVYPGTRFYLIGTIEPKEETDKDYERRAFTKDYTTNVDIVVASLAKAYNAVPDILSPRLEVGVLLNPMWTMVTPTGVALN